jgi:hypothetical protein
VLHEKVQHGLAPAIYVAQVGIAEAVTPGEQVVAGLGKHNVGLVLAVEPQANDRQACWMSKDNSKSLEEAIAHVGDW